MPDTEGLPSEFLKLLQPILSSGEMSEFIATLSESPHTSVRLNPNKCIPAFPADKVPWCTNGLYLDERPSFTLDPLFHAGAYYVQETSSMFLEQVVGNYFSDSQEIKALDLCAAPGGKSTHLLSLLSENSLLISNEVIRSRAGALSENLQKWGNANIVVTQNDPSDFKTLTGYFDLIVVDAPCSGEGLFRKDSGAVAEWSIKNVQLCAQRQRRILSDIFPSLSQNGLMIYCTCTYNSIENEGNLTWFKNHHDIEFIRIAHAPAWGLKEINTDGIIGYRFMPHRTRGEGFFISGFVKRNKGKMNIPKMKPDAKSHFKLSEKLKNSINNHDEFQFTETNSSLRFFPKRWDHDIQIHSKILRCLQVGTLAGTMKRDKFIPEHSYALSKELNKGEWQLAELSKEDAIRYLRKESIHLKGISNGYTLITYQGLGLGWINQLDNRSNNLYPTNWRIKMRS